MSTLHGCLSPIFYNYLYNFNCISLRGCGCEAVIHIKVNVDYAGNFRRKIRCIALYSSFQGIIRSTRGQYSSKQMYSHSIFYCFLISVSIRPPKKLRKVHMFIRHPYLIKYCCHICHNRNRFFPELNENPNKRVGEVRPLQEQAVKWCSFLYVAPQSNTTLIFPLVGWWTPCWGMYHTFPSSCFSWSMGTTSA